MKPDKILTKYFYLANISVFSILSYLNPYLSIQVLNSPQISKLFLSQDFILQIYLSIFSTQYLQNPQLANSKPFIIPI